MKKKDKFWARFKEYHIEEKTLLGLYFKVKDIDKKIWVENNGWWIIALGNFLLLGGSALAYFLTR